MMKKISTQFPVCDAHCDIALDVLIRRERGESNVLDKQHYSRLRAGGVSLQVIAIYVEAKDKPHKTLEKTVMQLAAILKDLCESKNFYLVKSRADLENFPRGEQIGVIMAIEGAEFLEQSADILELVWILGVRMIGLTWNQSNQFAHGIDDADSDYGVTSSGERLLKEFDRYGMILDVSHLSPASIRDVLCLYEGPVVASHCGVRRIYDCHRNLYDQDIAAIVERGGVIGIPAFPSMLAKQGASMDSFIQHLKAALLLAGDDHVGIGADFIDYLAPLIADGAVGEEWCVPENERIRNFESARHFLSLPAVLEKQGFSEIQIKKIMVENFLRFFQKVLPK